MSVSSSSSGGLRILRTRVVLLALPGLVALLYLTSAYYSRDITTERSSWLHYSSSNEKSRQATTSTPIDSNTDWQEQADLRDVCWAQWFSKGTVCQTPPKQWSQQDKLDLSWTWSNTTLADSTATVAIGTASNATAAVKAHAASDLLRYSLRSAQQYMHGGFGKVTLLTPDVPTTAPKVASETAEECTHTYQDHHGITHTGQRPCWLASVDSVYEPPTVLHHRRLACSSKAGKEACQESLLTAPKAATTTLLAAEAKELSDVRLVISPHHIFADDVSASDFWSPLYGPAFRLASNTSAEIRSATQNETDAVNAPFVRAAELLDQRFATRTRRTQLDLPQPLSGSILQEMQQLWPQQLSLPSTTSSENVDLHFLTTHYLVEKHREALLWSFMVAKHDCDGDGSFSPSEAQALLKDLGADATKKYAFPQVEMPIRTTKAKAAVTENLSRAGMPARLGHEMLQSSMDGSALIAPRSPEDDPSGIVNEEQDGANPLQIHAQNKRPVVSVCTLARECLAPLIDMVESDNPQHAKPSTAEVFKRVALQAPVCGDCMILHLTSQSGTRGLSAFLPSSDLEMASNKTLPLTSNSQPHDFALHPVSGSPSVKRINVASSLLARYAHTIILQEPFVAPKMTNRLEAKVGLTTLEFFNTSSLFSFKQHGEHPDPTQAKTEDAWIWTKYVRAWLSLRYPFPMRFESHTTEF